MEIIDAGSMGVRSAILRLTRRATPLKFTIYPMIHIAERAFYTEISGRLAGHDLIVAEGIRGADRRVRRLTRVYQWAGGSDRLGLVVQSREVVEVGVPIVWADMTGEEFDRKWRQIPAAERITVAAAAPLVAMYLRLFGTRQLLARFLRLDDDIAVDDWNPESGLDRLVDDEREALLVKALGQLYEQRRDEQINIAIVYGAWHALPVVRYLMSALDYVVTKAEWVRVFDC